MCSEHSKLMNHLVCKNILCFSEFTLLLWEIVPGKYGEYLEQMGFNDESETDYLDSVKLCTDLVWRHGTVRHFNTNRENWKTVYVSEYQVKQEEAPPQTRHRPAGEPHHSIRHTLHLGLRKIYDDNSGEQCSVDKSSVYGSCLAMRTLVFFMQFQ